MKSLVLKLNWLLTLCVGLLSCGSDDYIYLEEGRGLSADYNQVEPINSLDATPASKSHFSKYISVPYSEPHGGTALSVSTEAFTYDELQETEFSLTYNDLDVEQFELDFNYRFTEDSINIKQKFGDVLVGASTEYKPSYYLNLIFSLSDFLKGGKTEDDLQSLAIVYDYSYESSSGQTIHLNGVIPFSSRKVSVVDSNLILKMWLYGTYTLVSLEEPIYEEFIMGKYVSN